MQPGRLSSQRWHLRALGPHPTSSVPVGTDGTQHLAALDHRSQGFLVIILFFCLTTKNPKERGMSENKAQWDALSNPGCFGTFAKVTSPLCEFPSTQHKQSKPEAGGLFKLVSLLWHITNRQKPLSATSAGCDICWCLWL